MTNLPAAVAKAFVRAINRQDPDALSALMSADHLFTDSLGNAVQGRDAMRAGWAAYFRMVPDYTLAFEEIFADGPVVVMLGVASGTYAADGQLKPENRWQTPLAVRGQIADGLVTQWRVYADNEPIRRLMQKS